MRMTWQLGWIMVLCCAPLLALAQGDINIEQRLTPAQMHATGLDTLTPTQRARLNQVVRAGAGPPSVAPLPPTGAARMSRAAGRHPQTGCGDGPAPLPVGGRGWGGEWDQGFRR